MSLKMAHKVILPPQKNYIPQFLKQRDINSYCLALAACSSQHSTVQNIIFLAAHVFTSLVPIAQQPGQAVVLGRLSLSLWC
jgi:hypothetical protein